MKLSVFAWLALVLSIASGYASPERGLRFSFQHYGPESGLGNSTVLSLLQDKTGFLWVGTESGLYRYEGSRFRLVGAADGLPCLAEIRGLAESEDGALWALACNHLYRSFHEDAQNDRSVRHAVQGVGHFELVPTSRDIIMDSLQGLSGDGQSGVLIGTPEGLLHAFVDEHGRVTSELHIVGEAVRGKAVRGVYFHEGTLWFASEHALWSFKGGLLTRYGRADGLPDGDWDAIRFTPDGDLWVRSAIATYRRMHGQTLFRALPPLAPSFSSGYLSAIRDGSMLIPTTNGLVMVKGGSVETVGEPQGLKTSLANVALEDKQGSIWVGLLGEGLARWLGRNQWESLTKESGLPSNVVWSVQRAGRDNSLWVGTAQGIVRFAPYAAARVWNWSQHINGAVRWLREAPDGGIWLVAQGNTLARIDPRTNEAAFFGAAEGMTAKHLVRGNFDHVGRLWIATREGVFGAQHATTRAHFDLLAGSPKGAWDVAEDKEGALLVTTARGLWRYKAGQWVRFGKGSGLLTDSEYVIAIAPDGAAWLRHRYDGIVERVVFANDQIVSDGEIKPPGVPTELTALHGFDAMGHYWQGTPHGLSMLETPSQWQSGDAWRYFSLEDGLVSNDCDGGAFWADRDGSVWIGTSGGLAHYSAGLEQGRAGESEMGPVITSMQVSQRPRGARIEFSSLDFKTESQSQFAYSIDGGNWIDAKERAVTFAGLRPGEHVFRVRVRSWGSGWKSKTAAAQFRFDAFWWETWWALLGLYAVGIAGLFGLLRWWTSAQRRKAEERDRILQEKARAEAASQAKSLFLAHMSHEIRTPLHQIMGLTEDLYSLNLPGEAHEITRQLRSSGSGLYGLLNGILDFSKIEAGKLEIETAPFNLPGCLEESVALFLRSAAEKGIELNLNSDGTLPTLVSGDCLRLRQVLICLISNAVKFTEVGEVQVRTKVLTAKDGQAKIEFSIADSGIGIAKERLSKLFQAFTQGDASISRQYGGTGLGLTIARSLVQLMGGDDLSVDSQAGEGTTFRFSLTFGLPPAAEKVDTVAARTYPSLRILVAEDNKINQKIILNLLARIGHQADLVSDGIQAIVAVERNAYDLVLMDIQMPHVDGFEATRAIRATLAGRTQPRIYAVTAHATADDRKACLDAGMNGYLTKPLSQERLTRTLVEVQESIWAEELAPAFSE